MIVVGEQEENANQISVRRHGGESLGSMNIESFAQMINEEIKQTLKSFK